MSKITRWKNSHFFSKNATLLNKMFPSGHPVHTLGSLSMAEASPRTCSVLLWLNSVLLWLLTLLTLLLRRPWRLRLFVLRYELWDGERAGWSRCKSPATAAFLFEIKTADDADREMRWSEGKGGGRRFVLIRGLVLLLLLESCCCPPLFLDLKMKYSR